LKALLELVSKLELWGQYRQKTAEKNLKWVYDTLRFSQEVEF